MTESGNVQSLKSKIPAPSSNVFPLTRPLLLNHPNSTTNWETGIQVLEPWKSFSFRVIAPTQWIHLYCKCWCPQPVLFMLHHCLVCCWISAFHIDFIFIFSVHTYTDKLAEISIEIASGEELKNFFIRHF